MFKCKLILEKYHRNKMAYVYTSFCILVIAIVNFPCLPPICQVFCSSCSIWGRIIIKGSKFGKDFGGWGDGLLDRAFTM